MHVFLVENTCGMMNKLRAELREILDAAACRRPPALRRSLRPDAIYATDFPQIAEENAIRDLVRQAEAAGWTVALHEGWLHFAKKVTAPPEELSGMSFGKEAACCASLLERHADTGDDAGFRTDGDRICFCLIKAAEEGPASYEQVCRELHREWAERLRMGKKIPSLSERWFRIPSQNE